MEARKIRGMAILSKGDLPKQIDREHFSVPSQSGQGSYSVEHLQAWTCSCPDFEKNQKPCKHIYASKFFLKMRHKAELEDFDIAEELNPKRFECPSCYSDVIVKWGKRQTTAGLKQVWKCRACGKKFTLNPLKRVKANAKIITLTMDLYFKGLSLRDISDTIYQFYGQRIHFDTIRRWINKFTAKMEEYTKKFTPELSGTFHTDEQMVKSKGKWVYAWNTIDKETRFVLASTITKERKVKDAQKHFQEVKENNPLALEPERIITDKLRSYNKAIKKEFRTQSKRTEHISIVGQRKKVNNNLIERYHNEFREFDKTRRGFKSDHTTQAWANGHRLYHNYIKENSTIGKTPAEQAGIEIELERNKWLSLLERSLI